MSDFATPWTVAHQGSHVHGTLQARTMEWVAISFLLSSTVPYARLDEAQAGIKIAKRSINNLRYADDPTLMAESEEK